MPGSTRRSLLVVLVLVAIAGGACTLPAPTESTPGPPTATPVPRSSPADNLDLRLELFRTELAYLREDLNIPGMSVVVIHAQEIVLAEGFGYADLTNEIPATASTPYRIASLTKPITAVLIMQLVEEGAIELDAPLRSQISDYDYCAELRAIRLSVVQAQLADYPCETGNPTVRQHLSHTTEAQPGTHYRYNGVIYSVLGWLAGSVAGENFATLLVERIIEPLEMDDTAFALDTSFRPDVLQRMARPYQRTAGGQIAASVDPGEPLSASAGIVSTALDLAKFDIALDTDELITPESRAALFTPSETRQGDPLPYGMGWFVQDFADTRLVWHYGWQPVSYSGLLLKVPEHDLTLILLANSDAASAGIEHRRGLGLEHGDVFASPFAATFVKIFLEPK